MTNSPGTASDGAGCIFCKIIAGQIPSTKIYEDEHTLAFLDIRPVNPGHTLVIPKAHYRNIFDVPGGVWEHVAKTARIVASAVRAGAGAEGVNVSSSHEPSAGQEVLHLHLHIIPRFASDGLKHWPQGEYKADEVRTMAEKIRSEIT